MPKPKQRASKRSPKAAKAAKAATKPVKAKSTKKVVSKPIRKAPVKAAKSAKPVSRKTKAVTKAAKPAGKVVKRATTKALKPSHAAKVVKPALAGHAQTAKRAVSPVTAAHHAAHGAAHAAKPAPARPTGGVAARLNVAAVDAQTLTREDGRYALPATVNIDLPKGYRPSDKDEYMGPRQLAYFRQKLKEWRDQLVEESRQTMENLRSEVRDVGDDAERATRETENSLELRTRDRYRKLISKIGLERLEARPIAILSLDAQERREHLQKQMGD